MTDNPQGSDIFNEIFNPQEPAAESAEEVEESNPQEIEGDEETEAEEIEQEEAEPEAEPTTFKLKAGGEEHELTLEQLQEYAQKGIGFYKNSEKLAKEHKAKMAELEAAQEAVAARLEEAQQFFDVFGKSKAGKEHLDYLLEYDLDSFKKLKAMQETVAAKVAEVQAESQQNKLNQALGMLQETFPAEWAKSDTRKKLLDDGAQFFESIGLTAEEIARVTDGAAFVAAIKAKRYDELMKDAAKLKEKPAPVKKKIAKAAAPTKAEAPKDAVAEWFPFLK